jgi:hypothetical protein
MNHSDSPLFAPMNIPVSVLKWIKKMQKGGVFIYSVSVKMIVTIPSFVKKTELLH